MASYEYLISSLPMLRAEGDLPISYETFLETCRSVLSQKRFQALETLTLTSSEGPLVSEWARFYSILIEELNYQRNQRLGRPCEPPSDRDEAAQKVVTEALNAKNPLDAEQLLLALEFERLDSLTGTHYFDDYCLNGYALKLLLLKRRTVFDKEKGRAEFGRLFDHIQQQILNI